MKRLLSIIAIISVVFVQDLTSNVTIFQDEMDVPEVEETSMAVEEVVMDMEEPEQLNFHQELNQVVHFLKLPLLLKF